MGTNQGTKNNSNSIVNVVVNGMTAVEVIDDVKNRLTAIEKSAFNIALECAYVLGTTIPAYTDNKGIEHGVATIDKPIKKQADLLKLVGRSKATLSRWIKAITLIIENDRFLEFANGTYPFSYDKIITIFDHKEKFEGHILSDLMTMTVDTLEAMTATKEEKTEEPSDSETATDNDDKEEKTEEPTTEETAVLIYQDKKYKVNKVVFEKWLAENATLA